MRKRSVGVGFLLATTLFTLGTGTNAVEPERAFAQVQPQAAPKPPRPAPPPAAQAQATRPATPAAAAAQKPAGGETQSASANPAPAPGGGWVAKCVSESRQSPLECSMEQAVVLTNTGQLVASLLVRVPTDTHQPVMMIQLPIGLFLPAGINLQVDEGKPQPVPVQTCDGKGCYAGMQISAELIGALKSGKRLTLTFQNMAKNNIVVPMALDNFADAYQKIQ